MGPILMLIGTISIIVVPAILLRERIPTVLNSVLKLKNVLRSDRAIEIHIHFHIFPQLPTPRAPAEGHDVSRHSGAPPTAWPSARVENFASFGLKHPKKPIIGSGRITMLMRRYKESGRRTGTSYALKFWALTVDVLLYFHHLGTAII